MTTAHQSLAVNDVACAACSAEAKAFALMSEEGIAKGVRRIVAVTAAEAEAAIAEGERLAGELEAAAKLESAQQEKEVSTLKQVCSALPLAPAYMQGAALSACLDNISGPQIHAGFFSAFARNGLSD